jgi:hypothetical protein
MHRPLSFAMQRVYFQTKRSFPTTNSAAKFALNNYCTHVVGIKERECVASLRVVRRQQCGCGDIRKSTCRGSDAGTRPQSAGYRLTARNNSAGV